MKPLLARGLRWVARLVVVAVALVLGALLVVAWYARSVPDLAEWHREAPEGEFEASDAREGFELADYLSMERALFDDLPAYAVSEGESVGPFVRYVAGGPHDPAARATRNWNRSFELEPAGTSALRGGCLLLHGLTDSPYSLRSVAELLSARGYHVLALRLPGHGTVPAALLEVEWEDWAAAVRIGARHVARRVGGAGPLHLVGYSCGGALALDYALDALRDPDLPQAARIVLISPAIGVTAFARISNWHRVFSWIPAFEKSRWLDVYPEIDPYKYASFPKNAGRQMWALAARVRSGLAALQAQGRSDELPAVLAFQSVVDATVLARELVTGLYDRLPANGSELVVFDLNRAARLDGLFALDHRAALRALEESPALPYRFTVVTNESPDSGSVVARSLPAGGGPIEVESLPLAWPATVHSLSHVALPFPPDDPTYGVVPATEGGRPPVLGNIVLRGESGALAIPPAQLLRLRHNPFHAYMLERIAQTLDAEG